MDQGGQKRVQLSRQTQNLTLSAWDLARTRTQQPDSARGHIMTLRAHQQLVASFESERNIPEVDRSFLQVKEGAGGSVLLIHHGACLYRSGSVSITHGYDLRIRLIQEGPQVRLRTLPPHADTSQGDTLRGCVLTEHAGRDDRWQGHGCPRSRPQSS